MDDNPIAWVSIIPPQAATGDLQTAYDTVKGPDGTVENLYLAMCHTPRAIGPADAHYLALLHDPASPLSPWLAELLGTYVAVLCGCGYAEANHGKNFETFFGDAPKATAIRAALHDGTWPEVLPDPAARAALHYAHKLSLHPSQMTQADLLPLREAGFSDAGLSYIIQITAAFGYWARMINGLGTQLGDQIGLPDAKPTQSRR